MTKTTNDGERHTVGNGGRAVKPMTGGTLFSGIGAPEYAMPWIDWRWCAEIESFSSAVHAARFPTVQNLGNVTKVRWEDVEPVDLIVFGSPCQSFSVAGKRAGLDDHRGNLALVALGIIARIRPRWFVFENVPGLLSSGERRDFGTFLRGVEDIGYSGAWGVLDAQWFGLAQLRRRLFFVGHSGDWRGPAAVLSECHRLSGDSPPSRTAREEVADSLEGDTEQRGWCNDTDRMTFVPETTYGLNAKGGSGRMDGGSETFVATEAGYWREGLGTLRAMPHDRSHANAGGQVAVCFESRVARNGRGGPSELVPPLKAQSGGSGRGDGAPLLAVSGTLAVRRLTPRECERLMGFPDGWTAIRYRAKPAADGPRYKVIGNSMAVPVLRYLGERIRTVDAILSCRQEMR